MKTTGLNLPKKKICEVPNYFGGMHPKDDKVAQITGHFETQQSMENNRFSNLYNGRNNSKKQEESSESFRLTSFGTARSISRIQGDCDMRNSSMINPQGKPTSFTTLDFLPTDQTKDKKEFRLTVQTKASKTSISSPKASRNEIGSEFKARSKRKSSIQIVKPLIVTRPPSNSDGFRSIERRHHKPTLDPSAFVNDPATPELMLKNKEPFHKPETNQTSLGSFDRQIESFEEDSTDKHSFQRVSIHGQEGVPGNKMNFRSSETSLGHIAEKKGLSSLNILKGKPVNKVTLFGGSFVEAKKNKGLKKNEKRNFFKNVTQSVSGLTIKNLELISSKPQRSPWFHRWLFFNLEGETGDEVLYDKNETPETQGNEKKGLYSSIPKATSSWRRQEPDYYMQGLKKAVWQNYYVSADSVAQEFKNHFEKTHQQLVLCKNMKFLQSKNLKKNKVELPLLDKDLGTHSYFHSLIV